MVTNKEAAERLKFGRDRLINKGWCQGRYAKNAVGEDINENNPMAVSFCAVGALGDGSSFGRAQAIELLQALVNPTLLVKYNDAPDRTKDEIIALYDWAIGTAEAGVDL